MTEFGVRLPQVAIGYRRLREIVAQAEKLGFSSIWLSDHVDPKSGEKQNGFLECWTTLSSLATITNKLRLGCLVLCNSFRYPSLLAKMSSTLDVISNGRLEFGIGVGWYTDEARSYGIPFPNYHTRVEQLKESLQIIKKLWTEEMSSFDGKFYKIRNAFNYPKPVQEPHPRMWIGGHGRELLKITAEFANVCNFGGTPEEYKSRLEILERYCNMVRRDYEAIEKSTNILLFITRFSHRQKNVIDKRLSEQRVVLGHPSAISTLLKKYISLGVTHFILSFVGLHEIENMCIFADEVMPELIHK